MPKFLCLEVDGFEKNKVTLNSLHIFIISFLKILS